MDLLVVGAGDMGRWFAGSLRPAVDAVAFADVDPGAAEAAAASVDGTAVDPDTERRFDVVCIAVPLPDGPRVIEAYADRVGTATCDVTGTMLGPVAAMRDHCPDGERLSMHPLFSPANAPGTIAYVADADGPLSQRIRERLAAEGNRLVPTAPAEHDEAMETVQARAHAAVLAFGLAAEEVPEKFQTPISAGLIELVEAVTDGDPRVYADIQAAFEGAEEVAEAAREIADADRERFRQLYDGIR
jgi:prephenate dehydrogenase